MEHHEHRAGGKYDRAAMPRGHAGHGEEGHDYGAMIADFKRRFWVSPIKA